MRQAQTESAEWRKGRVGVKCSEKERRRAMKCFHPTKSEDREERDSRKREEPMYEFLRESICVEQKMKGDVFGIRSRIFLNRRR
uniref:Uncharacterized protein n=1 Tax=Vespula pensylvanica TaxID=30213 RepID=A0A834UGC8_VESPE|nr:hypothetical protein H0235_000982 [Vespula pensylvanica]